MSTLSKVFVGAIPMIAGLVAAAFIIPADFPLLPRQFILFAWGIGGVVLAEYFLFNRGPARIMTAIGMVAPRWRAVTVALLVSVPMWVFLPLYGPLAGIRISLSPQWGSILLGIILVNGLTEEIIHRSFIFGHLRNEYSFARAASISAMIFALQHVYLLFTVGSIAGSASILLALLLALPFAFIFEASGRSLLPPAILHTSSNAPIMLFLTADGAASLALPHMAIVLAAIYLTFAFAPWLRSQRH